METTPVVLNSNCDTAYLRGRALAELQKLKWSMRLGNLVLDQSTVKLGGGVIIKCTSCYGTDEVYIQVPTEEVISVAIDNVFEVDIVSDMVWGLPPRVIYPGVLPDYGFVIDVRHNANNAINVNSNLVIGTLVRNTHTRQLSISSNFVSHMESTKVKTVKLLSDFVLSSASTAMYLLSRQQNVQGLVTVNNINI